MRIAFIGCVNFSAAMLRELIELPEAEVVGVVTRSESTINSDFESLQGIADSRGIPCLIAERNDQESIRGFILSLQADVVYCIGWSYLLQPGILQSARLGVVGYHPALLPRNRGRHPIIWAIALGLTETGSTFFFMDNGADSGDLLNQRKLTIEPKDDAGSIYAKLTGIASEQLAELTAALARGSQIRAPQDITQANTWRRRSRLDGRIDWRMSSYSIHNLVRALTRPYVGAHCETRAGEQKIWRTAISDFAFPANLEPGKVLSVEQSRICVKTGDGAIDLLEHEFAPPPRKGEYL